MQENSPTTPLERPPDVNLGAALKILKEGSSKSERVSIPYDSAWNGLKMSPNPTKYITDTLAGFLSNPPDRLNQFAHALAGLVRFYKAFPDKLLNLVQLGQSTVDDSDWTKNLNKLWLEIVTHKEQVVSELSLAVEAAIYQSTQKENRDLNELQEVRSKFLKTMQDFIDDAVLPHLNNATLVDSETPDLVFILDAEKDIKKIIEFEPFTDSKLANIIINIALTRMAQHLAKKHRQKGKVDKYKLFLNKVFKLRFPKEGEQMGWEEIAEEMQEDKEFEDINIGKSDSAVHNHFTALHRHIIAISQEYGLDLDIEQHPREPRKLTGKL